MDRVLGSFDLRRLAGGDGVSAVRLNSSQLAWFFSDTTIGPAGPTTGFSHLSGFVHNSLVIQTTAGPGGTFVTMTGGGACTGPGRPGNAAPVVGPPPPFPGGPSDKYWEEDGLQTGGTVVKFYEHYLAGIEPYVPVGTVIATFPVSQLSSAGRGHQYGVVARPHLVPLPPYTPPGGGSPILWGAALLRTGNVVYVYGTQSPDVAVPDRLLYLARVPVSQLTSFEAWRFYAGAGRWAAGQRNARPVQPPGSEPVRVVRLQRDPGRAPLLADPGRDDTRQPGHRRLPGQHAVGPVRGRRRTAAVPGSGHRARRRGRVPHHVRGAGRARAFHRHHAGDQLQRQLRGGHHRLRADVHVHQHGDTAPVHRRAAGRIRRSRRRACDSQERPVALSADRAADPAQWFDAWKYPGDCPPVPAVVSVRATPGPGRVALGWPDAGLDIHYRVYLQGPGEYGAAPVVSVPSGGATITGLRPGTYRAKVVPVNFYQHTGPAAEVTFTVP